MLRKRVRYTLFLVAAAIAGCNNTPAPSNSPGEASAETGTRDVQVDSTSEVQSDAVPPESKVELSVASWDEIQSAIAKHSGKVVVLDLWSTSCGPCLRELPKLAELHKQHPESVVCMSVSVDYTGAEKETPESHREKVMKILESRNMTFQNFISSTSDFDVYDTIGLASIPAVFVYDRGGQLVKRFDNDKNDYGDEGFTYADHIVPLVEQKLGE